MAENELQKHFDRKQDQQLTKYIMLLVNEMKQLTKAVDRLCSKMEKK